MMTADKLLFTLINLAGIFRKGKSVDELINGQKPAIDKNKPEGFKTATFSMGCFWGPDSLFGAIPGVINTKVGYAGGKKENPTYHRLGDHTETIQMKYDPGQVSYRELVDVFWKNQDPTQSKSTQYMSIIFFHDKKQQEIAEETKEKLQDETSSVIKTKIRNTSKFHLAEEYHQKYHLSKHKKLYKAYRNIYPETDEFIGSTAVTRTNGFVSGNGTLKSKDDLAGLGLSEEGREMVFKKWKSAGGV